MRKEKVQHLCAFVLQDAMYESFTWEELAKKIQVLVRDERVYRGPELSENECKAIAMGMFIAMDRNIGEEYISDS